MRGSDNTRFAVTRQPVARYDYPIQQGIVKTVLTQSRARGNPALRRLQPMQRSSNPSEAQRKRVREEKEEQRSAKSVRASRGRGNTTLATTRRRSGSSGCRGYSVCLAQRGETPLRKAQEPLSRSLPNRSPAKRVRFGTEEPPSAKSVRASADATTRGARRGSPAAGVPCLRKFKERPRKSIKLKCKETCRALRHGMR